MVSFRAATSVARPAAELISSLLDIARRGERTLVMGVLNVTPDSFSDGGRFYNPDAAIEHSLRMVEQGADIVDVGGESTRPGAAQLTAAEELNRVLPVIEALAPRVSRLSVPLSIDTYKAEVAREAVRAGATMVNDVGGLMFDPAMARTVAELGVPVCIMHNRGGPSDMHRAPHYGDVVQEVREELAVRVRHGLAAGIAEENVVLDPGFGFAKNAAHNLELLRHLGELTTLGYPLLAGTSRKSTIGKILGGAPPDERLEGTAATVALSIAYGAAIVRVHDVASMVRVVRVADAVVRGNWRE